MLKETESEETLGFKFTFFIIKGILFWGSQAPWVPFLSDYSHGYTFAKIPTDRDNLFIKVLIEHLLLIGFWLLRPASSINNTFGII